MEKVCEKLVVEQLMNVLPREIRIWVAERKPTTGSAAGALADDYLPARLGDGTGTLASMESKRGDKSKTESRKCHKCKQAGHLMSDFPLRDPPKETHANKKEKPNRGTVKCYNCGRMGHVAIRCPNNVLFSDAGTRMSVWKLIDEEVMVKCAHGDTALYLLAEVKMELEGMKLNVKAAGSESLQVSFLLGTDVAELNRLLRSDHGSAYTRVSGEAMVVTRAQAEREEEEELSHRAREKESGVQPHPVWEDPQ